MPIYEYNCEGCSQRFEELIRSQSDDASVRCNRCGSTHVKRAMSVCGMTSSNPSSGARSAGGGCSGCSSHNCGHCHH